MTPFYPDCEASILAVLRARHRDVYVLRFADADGRTYELAIHATADGLKAIAFLTRNPWPHDCSTWGETLLAESSQICLNGRRPSADLAASSLNLIEVLDRARSWCLAYSHFQLTGDGSPIARIVHPEFFKS